MSDHAAIRKVAEAAVQASESAMVNPHRIIQLLDTIESTESKLSQALRELGEANTARVDLQRFIVGLTKQLATASTSNAELRGALEWYANESNYKWDGAPMTPFVDGKRDPGKPEKDFGLIARTALASSSGEGS